MEKGYFAAAWGDVAKSPGWASVVLRLGLLCLIPIFGVVVMYGYLFSWARDIAWNVHRPLPRKIFANEDGSLYRRGFFILVVALVFSLVPELVNLFIGMSAGFSFGGTALYGSYVPALFGSMIWLAGNSASAALSFFTLGICTPPLSQTRVPPRMGGVVLEKRNDPFRPKTQGP